MAVYTYYAFDVLSGDIITELPLRGAQPSWQVNTPGDLGSPTISLQPLSTFQRSDIRTATIPWKTGVVVDRDGVIIWSGIVTTRRYASAGRAFTLTVPGLLSYWQRRYVDTNITWAGAEQFDLVTGLLQYGGSPTVPVQMDPWPSGVTRDQTIAGSDFSPVLDVILQLADNLNGFELALDTAWDTTPGTQSVVHSLRIGSPRLGRVDDGSGGLLTLEFPGNVRGYTWDEDGEQFATQVYGSSTDTNGDVTTVAGQNPALINSGYPQVGATRQWSNITVSDTLNNHVTQAITDAAGFQDAPTFTVLDSGDTAAGSWTVGDDVRIRITDDCRFPVPAGYLGPGLDLTVRLSQAQVDPSAQTVQMTMFGFTEVVT